MKIVFHHPVSGSASFTRTDGSTGTAYNLDLAVNTYQRKYRNNLAISAEYADLPNMSGTGRVRDLLQAATRNHDLATVLETFSAGTTRSAQMAVLENLVQTWANTSDMKSSHQQALDQGDLLVYVAGIPNTYIMGEPVLWIQTPSGPGGWTSFLQLKEAMQSNLTPEYAEWINRVVKNYFHAPARRA